MKFAMFYEIPVPKPWTPERERQAYKNTHEQVMRSIELLGKYVIPELDK